MKIALIYPTSEVSPESANYLGISYIAAVLMKHNYEVDLYDCSATGMTQSELFSVLAHNRYDVVGMTAYYSNYVYVLRTASYLKKINPDTFVFIGGYYPTLNYKNMSCDLGLIDCMIIGEGELPTLQLLNSIQNKSYPSTKGIYYKDNTGFVYTGPGDHIKELDELPYPIRTDHARKRVNISASRGCYGNCSYCCIDSFLRIGNCHQVRRRSPENVVAELTEIYRKSGIHEFNFIDDNFSFRTDNDRRWFKNFITLVRGTGIPAKFACQIRANEIIEYTDCLREFIANGLNWIFVGIESFLQPHLDFYKKNLTIETNIKCIKALQAANIPYSIGYMLFNPLTTLEDILQTLKIFRNLDFLHELYEPIFLSNTYLISFPGTAVHDYITQHHLNSYDSKGYRFKDERVQPCFDLMRTWGKIALPILRKLSHSCEQTAEITASIKHLIHMDLNLMENTVSVLLKSRNKDPSSELQSLLQSQFIELDHQKQQLLSIRG